MPRICAASMKTVDDEGVASAKQEHSFGDEIDAVRGVDTHDLRACACGIGERAKQIEGGADAESAANGHHGLHGGVHSRGVQVGEAVGTDGVGGGLVARDRPECRGLRGRRRTRSLRSRHGCHAWRPWLRRAAATRAAAVEMLKVSAPSPAGATGVDQVTSMRFIQWNRNRGGAHGVHKPCEFFGSFAAGRRVLRVWRRSGHRWRDR